jgi:hypothetical protein
MRRFSLLQQHSFKFTRKNNFRFVVTSASPSSSSVPDSQIQSASLTDAATNTTCLQKLATSRKKLAKPIFPSSTPTCSLTENQNENISASSDNSSAAAVPPTPSRSPSPTKKGPKAKRSVSPAPKIEIVDNQKQQQQSSSSSTPSTSTDQHVTASYQELARLQNSIPIKKMSAALAEKKEHDKVLIAKGTEMLSNLPTIVKVFEKLNPDARRYIVVAAASEEWFGTPEVKTKLKEADALSDQRICATDYEQWIATSMRKRMESIPRSHFWLLVAFFGAPFCAMGFLDNCVFIFAGDAFDKLLFDKFGVTGMLCAGLAGVVSGMVGLQVHGMAARVISRTMQMPDTTKAQRMSRSFKTAKHWGGVLGLVAGLSLGVLPGLFLPAHRTDGKA